MDRPKATHRCKGCEAEWALMPPAYPNHCGDKGCVWCRDSSWTCVKPGRGYTMAGPGPICGPCCDVAAMTDQIEPLGFHAQDGQFFTRLMDGGVAVEKRTPDNRRLESRVVLTASVWASIVSSMSKEGETAETWQAALDKQR